MKENEEIKNPEITEEVKEDKKGKKEVKEDKEKTYTVRIPIDPLNPQDKEVIVGINEKYAKVVRGEDTEVSEPVYEQLKNAGLV